MNCDAGYELRGMHGAFPLESQDPFRGRLPEIFGRVRIADHRAASGGAPACDALISTRERELALRLREPELQSDRLAHYAARRLMLAELTGLVPQGLQITHSDKGEPALVGDSAPSISISRSGTMTCVAAATGGRVGVDIEVVSPRNWRPMLGMLSIAAEAQTWAAFLEQHDNPALAFLWLWTAKEAVLKADGTGLRAGPKSVPIYPELFLEARRSFCVEAFSRVFQVWTTDADGVVVSFARLPDRYD